MSNRFISIRKKMIALYLVLLLLPITFIGLAVYRQYTSSMERDVEIYLKQISEQINANIERYIQEANQLTILPLYDEDILDILRMHLQQPNTGGLVPSSEGTTMQMFMLSAGFDRPEIDEIVIYTLDGLAFSSLSSNYGYEHTRSPAEDTVSAKLLDIGIYLTTPYEKRVPESGRIKSVVSVYRKLRDPYEHRDIGWIRIDLNEKMFGNIITPPLKNYPSRIYIASNNHTVYYPTEEAAEAIPFLPQDRLEIDGAVYRCYMRRSEMAQMTTYQLIAERDLIGDATALIRFTALLALLVVSVAVLLAIVFAYKFTKPIKDLSSKMLVVEGSLLKKRLYTKVKRKSDELVENVPQICRSFQQDGRNREVISPSTSIFS